jgi:hypothetical protein
MRYSLLVLGTVLGLAAVGCSGKTTVSGTVTLDGKPLDNGTIAFFPIKGDGQTSSALIGKDGRYQTVASPTQMKVVIHSSKVVGQRKEYPDMPDSPVVDILQEILPPRYCDMNKTELTATIAPGKNEVNFDLKSDPKK